MATWRPRSPTPRAAAEPTRHPGASAVDESSAPHRPEHTNRSAPPDRQGLWMAPRGPVFPSASLGALLMAEIASAGRTGPLTPASIVWMPRHDSPTSPRDTRTPPSPARRHTRATPPRCSALYPRSNVAIASRHSPARSPHHSRDTLSNPRATPALVIRNNTRNTRASSSPYPRMMLRSNMRTTSASRSPVLLFDCALLVPVRRDFGALHVADRAQVHAHCMRRHCSNTARLVHGASAVASQPLAHAPRTTRAIVVAYRRECDAILTPMNPPQLPHTRATHPHIARSTGATAVNTLVRGGRS